MRRLLIQDRAQTTRVLVVVGAIIVIATLANIDQCFADQVQSPTLQPTQTVSPQASPSPSEAQPDSSGWHQNIDSLEKLVTVLAIIVGGVWAWLKFFRGRTFRSRLELMVSAKIITSGPNRFLKATMQMKNVGLSQVKLKKDALYLDVYLIDVAKVKPEQALYRATWEEPRTFEVFQDHGWVEPGEEINDQLLFQLPESEQLACKLKLTVNSPATSWFFFETEGTRWCAVSIVDCMPPTKTDESPAQEKGEEG